MNSESILDESSFDSEIFDFLTQEDFLTSNFFAADEISHPAPPPPPPPAPSAACALGPGSGRGDPRTRPTRVFYKLGPRRGRGRPRTRPRKVVSYLPLPPQVFSTGNFGYLVSRWIET